MFRSRNFIEADIEELFYRGSGKGGQNRNKVETGCYIVHTITGIIVACCVQRTQHANRKLAREILDRKLDEHFAEKEERRGGNLVIRTYHEPDNRVKDESGAGFKSWSETVGKGAIGPLIEQRFKFLACNPGARKGVFTGRMNS